MQILFLTAFVCVVAASLFIGKALALDYSPYATYGAGALYVFILFIPFMSEYGILHSGFSKMDRNFKKLMGNHQPEVGEMEIILPGHKRARAEDYNLSMKKRTKGLMLIFTVLACSLFMFDLVNFFVMGDGLPDRSNPISNF